MFGKILNLRMSSFFRSKDLNGIDYNTQEVKLEWQEGNLKLNLRNFNTTEEFH